MKTLMPHYDILDSAGKMHVTTVVVQQLLHYFGAKLPHVDQLIKCRSGGEEETRAVRRSACREVRYSQDLDDSTRYILQMWAASGNVEMLDAETFFKEVQTYIAGIIAVGKMSRTEAKAAVKRSLETLLLEARK